MRPTGIGTNNNSTNRTKGALCTTADPTGQSGPCGIPKNIWDSNGAQPKALPGQDAQGKQISDYFYQYGPLHGDGKCTDGSVFKVVNGTGACNTSTGQVGYFGNKVLAVSYGGVLALSGYKGATYDPVVDGDPLNSGTSWRRLQGSLEKGATSLLVERPVPNWRSGDRSW
jgi:cell migration-inducing and hyaluronan-binding protein